jgi:hypothetical protein
MLLQSPLEMLGSFGYMDDTCRVSANALPLFVFPYKVILTTSSGMRREDFLFVPTARGETNQDKERKENEED